jgi:hypothetical protein
MKRNILSSFIILTIIFSSCSNKTETPKIDFEQNKKSFESSIKTLVGVNEKMNELEVKSVQKTPTEESVKEDMKVYSECLNQLKLGIDESEIVSDEYLNYLHPELKQMFKGTYIASNKLWLLSQKEQWKKILNNPNGFGNLIDSIDFNEYKRKLNVAGGDSLTSKQIDDSLLNGKFGEYLGSESATSKTIDSLNSIWWSFVKTHQELLNDNDLLLGKKKSNKSYWKMLLYLGIGDFVVTLLYSLLVVLTMFLTIGLTKGAEKVGLGSTGTLILIIPKVIVSIGLQIYFWVLWASFCVFNVLYFMDSPQVTHNWLYYLTGFIAVSAPMSYLSSREQETESSYEAKKRISTYAGIYILISIAAYLLFCFYPKLLDYKFISFINDWLSSF